MLHEGSSEKANQKLGGSGVCFTYSTDTSSKPVSLPLYLAFDRATGKFKALQEVKDANDKVLNSSQTGNCTSITITSGAGGYTITLVPTTGYHYVSR